MTNKVISNEIVKLLVLTKVKEKNRPTPPDTDNAFSSGSFKYWSQVDRVYEEEEEKALLREKKQQQQQLYIKTRE